jgi:hypothetical protein
MTPTNNPEHSPQNPKLTHERKVTLKKKSTLDKGTCTCIRQGQPILIPETENCTKNRCTDSNTTYFNQPSCRIKFSAPAE